MNGYSKSRSIYLSDLQHFSQTPKPIDNTSPNDISKTQETKQIKTITNSTNKNTNTTHESTPDQLEGEDGNGEKFGVILGKKYSSVSSSTASHRFKIDKQGTTPTLQSAVKRALSMRRSSSSVSEGYCRIHDQYVTLASSADDDGGEGMYNNAMQTRSVKKKKKKKHQQQQHRTGKILKACKRFFGL